MDLPFDGAITKYLQDEAPAKIRKTIEKADKNDIRSDAYPYDEAMKKKDYEA